VLLSGRIANGYRNSSILLFSETRTTFKPMEGRSTFSSRRKHVSSVCPLGHILLPGDWSERGPLQGVALNFIISDNRIIPHNFMFVTIVCVLRALQQFGPHMAGPRYLACESLRSRSHLYHCNCAQIYMSGALPLGPQLHDKACSAMMRLLLGAHRIYLCPICGITIIL
jgi:hypothetical protein